MILQHGITVGQLCIVMSFIVLNVENKRRGEKGGINSSLSVISMVNTGRVVIELWPGYYVE